MVSMAKTLEDAGVSAHWKGILAAVVVAVLILWVPDVLSNIHHYVAPCTAAVFFFAPLPAAVQRWVIGTLVLTSTLSVPFHQLHRGRSRELGVRPGPGEVALVTGASSGIGREIAKELAKRGYGVVLVARREQKLQELAAEIRGLQSADGGDGGSEVVVHTVKADLGSPTEVARLHDHVTRKLNVTVSMLINNAGIGLAEDFLDLPIEKVDEMVGLNVVALTKLTRMFASDMVARGRGRVMTISSIAGVAPGPHVAMYSATKAYVNSLTQALQHELEPHGVGVTLVMPGATFTEFGTSAKADNALCFKLPGMAMRADNVASAAVDGFLRGDTQVIPGLVNKVYVIGTAWVPPKFLRGITDTAWRS